ncbi:hypothetical protein ALC62_01815 [Cyphomyrmex costatus]|uniref:RNase H type-1 domain-containing protein n=1 Tax=Cyphomyrmex costatus TaxID=456900 RepID=A0A151IP54_9HYME|nr:hypothetical protein ALC62_01815 [Cyphomyrmex costatus]
MLEYAHRLPPETSIFTAEAWAILVALKIILDENLSKAAIFSDSMSVLEAITSPRLDNGNYLIYIIKDFISQASDKDHIVDLIWIPSHSGIEGNGNADELAKLDAKQGDPMELEVPYLDFLSEAKSSASTQYKPHLDEIFQHKGLHYDQYFRSNSHKPWFNKHNKHPLGREEIVLVNRLRSNYYNLNCSLYRKNIVASVACPCGDPHQDINHIVFHCPITSPKSTRLISFIQSIPNTQDNIFSLLSRPNPKLIRLLLAFLKSNNLSI